VVSFKLNESEECAVIVLGCSFYDDCPDILSYTLSASLHVLLRYGLEIRLSPISLLLAILLCIVSLRCRPISV